MPEHTPETIIKLVNQLETDRFSLHDRMDKDFDRYNLKPYTGEETEDGDDALAGSKKFGPNDPRTSMNLAIHLVSTARRKVRVRTPQAKKERREVNNKKELFGIGVLTGADQRRSDLMMPLLQDALTSQGGLRGRTAQRVLLVKEDIEDPEEPASFQVMKDLDVPDDVQEELTTSILATIPKTRTFVDIQDWDPRNTYWGMGKHGLDWACHKVWKTRGEIESEFGIQLEAGVNPKNNRISNNPGGSSEGEFAVYDFFDSKENLVAMEGDIELKKRTPHGMGGKVPVDIHMVGALPLFQAPNHDYEVNYGESFYQSVREMYDQQSFILSILAELSARSINQGLLVMSADGTLTLKGDPRVTGAETQLSTNNSEDIKPMPPMEMVKESGAFMGIVSQMIQRGTFPASVFGDLAFQLSGFAITQLRQGMEAPISPIVKTVQIALTGIVNILAGAYTSGSFDVMTLSGRMQDVGRTDFEEEIPFEDVKNGGVIDIEIIPQLPQDDVNKAGLAKILTDGPNPIADHRFVRENILMFQDVEQMERAVQEQLAKSGSAASVAFSNMLASAEQGDMQLAEIWFVEFQKAMTISVLENQQVQSAAQGGGPTSDVAPPATMGIEQPLSILQAGSLQPAGAPRPGALAGPLDRGFG